MAWPPTSATEILTPGTGSRSRLPFSSRSLNTRPRIDSVAWACADARPETKDTKARSPMANANGWRTNLRTNRFDKLPSSPLQPAPRGVRGTIATRRGPVRDPVPAYGAAVDDRGTLVPQPTLHEHLPGSCELLLIRHGRSADVVPGSEESLDPGLHAAGKAQAAALAERLHTKAIDAVYASHLRRAVETG